MPVWTIERRIERESLIPRRMIHWCSLHQWSIRSRSNEYSLNYHWKLFLFDRREQTASHWTADGGFFLIRKTLSSVSPRSASISLSDRRCNTHSGEKSSQPPMGHWHGFPLDWACALDLTSIISKANDFLFSKTFMDVLTTLFLIVWFVYGNHILYRYRLPSFEQTTEDPEHWCTKNVYLLTIISVAYTYALVTLMLLIVLIVVITVHLRNRRRNIGETTDAVCSWLRIHIYFFSINIMIITVTHRERERTRDRRKKTYTQTRAHAFFLPIDEYFETIRTARAIERYSMSANDSTLNWWRDHVPPMYSSVSAWKSRIGFLKIIEDMSRARYLSFTYCSPIVEHWFVLSETLNVDAFSLLQWGLLLNNNQMNYLWREQYIDDIRRTKTMASSRPWIFSAIQWYCPKSSLLFIYSNIISDTQASNVDFSTWIVSRLLDIVWLTRVWLIRFSSIICPFFSQTMRANGRLKAWHSRVTLAWWALWITSCRTVTAGGSRDERAMRIPVTPAFTYIPHWSWRFDSRQVIRYYQQCIPLFGEMFDWPTE